MCTTTPPTSEIAEFDFSTYIRNDWPNSASTSGSLTGVGGPKPAKDRGVYFDGSDYFEMSGLMIDSNHTFLFWVRITGATTTTHNILSLNTSYSANSLNFRIHNDKMSISIAG